MSAVINIGIVVRVAEEVVNSWVFRDEQDYNMKIRGGKVYLLPSLIVQSQNKMYYNCIIIFEGTNNKFKKI